MPSWSAPDPGVLRYLVWAAGLLVAERVHLSYTERCRDRLVVGLFVGVVLAHLGWGLLHLMRLLEFPGWLLQPGAATILFLPLGILLVAPFREALAALPLALAVARLGCLPYDCCYEASWDALPELAGLIALHRAARRWPEHTTPIVLSGFGAIRLLSLPLRKDLAVEPFIDPAWVAFAWIVAGFLLRHRIGSAEDAREWFTARTEPLLRALALMLVVWLLFPLAAEVFRDPTTALLLGSLAASALVVALRRPVLPRFPASSAIVFASAVLLGMGVAHGADAVLGQLGFAALARPRGGVGPAHAFALVVLAPLFEELLYRERLLGVLRELWGWLPALLLSSALFALGHMDPGVMPVAFAGGLVCGAVMIRTGSLAAVIGLHAGWNLWVLAGS